MNKMVLILLSITINTTIILAQQLPTPGTDEWKKLPVELRRKACNIPEAELASLSTDALLHKCLNYRYMSDILFTTKYKGCLDIMAKTFNGLRELFLRSDAADAIFNYYKKLDPAQIDTIDRSIDKGRYLFDFVFLELYLTHPPILKQLKGKERVVIKEVLKKYNSCIQVNSSKDKYVYSTFPLNTEVLLIAVLLDNMNDNSIGKLKTTYPECKNVVDNLNMNHISEGLLNDLLKRAAEL